MIVAAKGLVSVRPILWQQQLAEAIIQSIGESLRRSPPFCLVVDMPDFLNMQTRMFCGFGPECAPDGDASAQALIAAERLESQFLLVGLTERMEEFFRVLEVGTLRFSKVKHVALSIIVDL
eukprot:scaffold69150_cov32-Prasinocladus_malaysianus.AAC.1